MVIKNPTLGGDSFGFGIFFEKKLCYLLLLLYLLCACDGQSEFRNLFFRRVFPLVVYFFLKPHWVAQVPEAKFVILTTTQVEGQQVLPLRSFGNLVNRKFHRLHCFRIRSSSGGYGAWCVLGPYPQ